MSQNYNQNNSVTISKKVFENHMVVADITVTIIDQGKPASELFEIAKAYVESAKVGKDSNGKPKA